MREPEFSRFWLRRRLTLPLHVEHEMELELDELDELDELLEFTISIKFACHVFVEIFQEQFIDKFLYTLNFEHLHARS